MRESPAGPYHRTAHIFLYRGTEVNNSAPAPQIIRTHLYQNNNEGGSFCNGHFQRNSFTSTLQ